MQAPLKGNIRELHNLLEGLCVAHEGPLIAASELVRVLDRRDPRSGRMTNDGAHGPTVQPIWTLEELRRLTHQTLNEFDSSRCEKDVSYRVSKSTASRHLNVLMAKALRLSDYSEARAVALMLKDAPASLRPVLAQRMNLFLEPLRRRLRMESPAELEISMERQYRGHAHELKLLCQALREARL